MESTLGTSTISFLEAVGYKRHEIARMGPGIMPPSGLCRIGITVTSWRAERGAIGRHNTKSSI